MTDLESEYSLLLARNNVLSERIEELEDAIGFTLKSFSNEGHIGYSSIEKLRAALKEQDDE